MNVHAAQWLLYGITAAGAVVWLASLSFLKRSFQAESQASVSERTADRFDFAERFLSSTIRGSVEVDGSPEELVAKAATVMAAKSDGATGPLKIVECVGNRLVFERGIFTKMAGTQPAARIFRRGQFRFLASSGRRTRIDYEIEVSSGRGFMLGGIIFQLLGLLALAIGFWLMHTYVVFSRNPGVRWQTIQMVQVVHFLWPPFLFGGLYRQGRSALRETFDVLLHNLPYCGT